MNDDLLIGGLMLALGTLAWVLPYRFNPLRPKSFVASMIPERWRPLVPRVLGTVALLMGAIILLGGFTGPPAA